MNLEDFHCQKDERQNVIYFSKKFQKLEEILKNTQISFSGKANVVFISQNAKLSDSKINLGENCLAFIGNSHLQRVHISAFKNSLCYIGNSNYFNPAGLKSISLSEQAHFIMGNSCLMSFNIWFRTADPHLIYDSFSHKRINPSKSICIGDHCWIAQDVAFLKGAYVASGAIIGARSVVAGKTYFSNTINAGNPCKELKNNIFWTGECVHTWDKAMSEKHEFCESSNFKFAYDEGEFWSLQDLEQGFKKLPSASQRLSFVYKNLFLNSKKNRFARTQNIENSYIRQNAFISVAKVPQTPVKPLGAVARIKQSLSYQLGTAMIEHSKSLAGSLKLPFVLLKISKNFKKQKAVYEMMIKINESFKRPPLESYDDYNETLSYKEHLRYKLGFALIQCLKEASNNPVKFVATGGGDRQIPLLQVA